MEKFGIDQRKVVSKAFNSIVEAFEKDIKNKTEETKIDITFREDNSIFIEAKAAIDKVYIKRGLVVLDFEKGFHVEAEGFNPEENMW